MNQTSAIEVTNFPSEDYSRLVSYEEWRVAALAACKNTTLEMIEAMQKHDETDEIFILMKGNATLITAGNSDAPGEIEICRMEPLKVYNIKKGYWHNHILDEEGLVLIVENENTCGANSPVLPLTEMQIAELEKKMTSE